MVQFMFVKKYLPKDVEKRVFVKKVLQFTNIISVVQLILLLRFSSLVSSEIIRGDDGFDVIFNAVNPGRMFHEVLTPVLNEDLGGCLYQCILHLECKTINHNEKENLCEIVGMDFDETVADLTAKDWRNFGTQNKVDGGFSDWFKVGQCSTTCGKGVQQEKRECDNPRPQHGGKDCVGNTTRNIECSEKPCDQTTTTKSSTTKVTFPLKETTTKTTPTTTPITPITPITALMTTENPFTHWLPWSDFTSCPVGICVQSKERTCKIKDTSLGCLESDGKTTSIHETIYKSCDDQCYKNFIICKWNPKRSTKSIKLRIRDEDLKTDADCVVHCFMLSQHKKEVVGVVVRNENDQGECFCFKDGKIDAYNANRKACMINYADLALNKVVKLGSTHKDNENKYGASLAIDDDENTQAVSKPVLDKNWWSIDLGTTVILRSISLNVGDPNKSSYEGLTITIKDKPGAGKGDLCVTLQSITKQITRVKCDNENLLVGVIRIKNAGTNRLYLSKVIVSGFPIISKDK